MAGEGKRGGPPLYIGLAGALLCFIIGPGPQSKLYCDLRGNISSVVLERFN